MRFQLILFSGCVAMLGWTAWSCLQSAKTMPDFVRVGDHHLRVLSQGQGTPSVVFESFGPAYLEHMNRVQPAISEITTTFNYDHAGHWFSEPGPKPRDARKIAEELHQALNKAKVAPPYVLVGFSFGGPYIRVFADKYPDEVAGMVFVDPSQESFMKWMNEEWEMFNVLTPVQKAAQTEWGCHWDSLNQATEAKLPQVPITLITGMMKTHHPFQRHYLPYKLKAHQEWLSNYQDVNHIISTNSAHAVPLSEPELIIDAIKEMIQKVRKNHHTY